MADVRPPSWPVVPQTPQRTDPRANAQRAFFQAALAAQGVGPATAQAEAPRATAARAPDLTIQMPKDQPVKIPRPGSIIDITV